MRPEPPGCGRDRRDAAGTAGMRPGPLGPPGRGRASGRIWTHSHREPEQILLSQWGPGRRPTATSVPDWIENEKRPPKAARNVRRRPGTSAGGQERQKAARNVRSRPGTSAGGQERPQYQQTAAEPEWPPGSCRIRTILNRE